MNNHAHLTISRWLAKGSLYTLARLLWDMALDEARREQRPFSCWGDEPC